ncbi:MAG: hypothetical protein CENE_03431 [Candidatus Celerinatantimonas neptuna]|nr:MAG: hypothetical protein CENE_03431 [Candidatus Celerinatantimonas neptuna]
MHLQLPLFPLPAQVMPGGKIPLRIIEPRHVTLIRDCILSQNSFGMVMINPDEKLGITQFSPVGTAVKVIDFNPLEYGLLGVTVLGYKRFKINTIKEQTTGLLEATIEFLPTWPVRTLPDHELYIAQRLCDVYSQYPELGELYQERDLQNLTWLCQRWLEILPISIAHKQELMATNSCERTHQLLTQILH